jgi:hypothetical protein
MRKFAMLAVFLCGLTIVWGWRRAPAATGTVDSAALFSGNIHTGDQVRVYLRHNSNSSTLEWVDGTLTGFDGSSFEVSGETKDIASKDNVTGMDDRKTLSIIPVSSVLFVQKTISEQFVPDTHP